MSRRSCWTAGVLGAAVAGLLVTGCGATENGSVIAVPPAAAKTAAAASTDSAVSGFQGRLNNQLLQAAQTGTGVAPHVKKVHTRLPPIRHHLPR